MEGFEKKRTSLEEERGGCQRHKREQGCSKLSPLHFISKGGEGLRKKGVFLRGRLGGERKGDSGERKKEKRNRGNALKGAKKKRPWVFLFPEKPRERPKDLKKKKGKKRGSRMGEVGGSRGVNSGVEFWEVQVVTKRTTSARKVRPGNEKTRGKNRGNHCGG